MKASTGLMWALRALLGAVLLLPGMALAQQVVSSSHGDHEEHAVIAAEAEPAPEPEPEAPKVLTGTWPTKVPRVSIDLKQGTVAQALEQVTEQAHWDLVLLDADRRADAPLTVRLTDRPATTALEIALRDTGLSAHLDEGILTIEAVRGASVGGGVDQRIKDKIRAAKQGRHRHSDDRTSMGAPLRIEVGEEVGDAVSIGGPLTVAGHVRGDAVSVGGPLELESTAVVDGDAVSLGGPIDIAPGAVLHGDRVAMSGTAGKLASGVVRLTVDSDDLNAKLPWFLVGVGASLVRAIVLFVLGLLLLTFMPERVERVRQTMLERPGQSVLGGLAVIIGFVPLVILLAITIIGIPLLPLLVLIVVALLVLGLTAFVTWLGERLPILHGKKSPVGAMAIGIALITVVDLVPFAGTAIVMLIGFYTAGAALLSRFGSAPKGSVTPPPDAIAVP